MGSFFNNNKVKVRFFAPFTILFCTEFSAEEKMYPKVKNTGTKPISVACTYSRTLYHRVSTVIERTSPVQSGLCSWSLPD